MTPGNLGQTVGLVDRYVMPTYRRFDVVFERGEGMYLFDEAGKKYLDFVAGIAVTALGHAHPAVTEAISAQASRLVHTSNLYYTAPMARLAEKLCELLRWPDGRVFFANSGAEANECAIKLVRRWAKSTSRPHRFGTIAAMGSFHGRTLETLAATGQPAKWEPFAPLPLGFAHVDFGDAAALEKAVDDSTCGVLLEPVQGEGGVIVPSDEYLPQVRTICDENDLAFIADEVQTGLGRTGEWFASAPARPDVITLAKALGNGLPIGACVARGELATAFKPGDHGTTIGGGPVVSAAALAVIETIEVLGLVENARSVGASLLEKLGALVDTTPLVQGARGKGLLVAVELTSPVARAVCEVALGSGLLVNEVTPSAVRLCPPLIVSEEQCTTAVEILSASLKTVSETL